MKATISVKGGTKRSWEREVGYGTMPEWYTKPFTVEIDVPEIDIAELTKRVHKDV